MRINELLEEFIREGIIEDTLDRVLAEYIGSENYEIDFEPLSLREA